MYLSILECFANTFHVEHAIAPAPWVLVPGREVRAAPPRQRGVRIEAARRLTRSDPSQELPRSTWNMEVRPQPWTRVKTQISVDFTPLGSRCFTWNIGPWRFKETGSRGTGGASSSSGSVRPNREAAALRRGPSSRSRSGPCVRARTRYARGRCHRRRSRPTLRPADSAGRSRPPADRAPPLLG